MSIPEIKVKISDIEFNIQSIAELLYHDFSEKNKTLPFKERVFRAFSLTFLSGCIMVD